MLSEGKGAMFVALKKCEQFLGKVKIEWARKS